MNGQRKKEKKKQEKQKKRTEAIDNHDYTQLLLVVIFFFFSSPYLSVCEKVRERERDSLRVEARQKKNRKYNLVVLSDYFFWTGKYNLNSGGNSSSE